MHDEIMRWLRRWYDTAWLRGEVECVVGRRVVGKKEEKQTEKE